MEYPSAVTQQSAPAGALCPPWAALFLLYSLVNLAAHLLDVASHGLVIQVAGPCLPPSRVTAWFRDQAVADATFTVLLPLTLTWTSSAWPLGSAFCHLDPHLAILSFYASGHMLTHAAANAFTALLQPNWAMTHRRTRRAVSWASGVWLLLLVLGALSLRLWRGRVDTPESCNRIPVGELPGCVPDLAFSGLALNQLVFCFGVLLGVMSAICGLVWAWLQLAKLTGRPPPLGALWPLGALLFLCWFPFHLLLLLQLLGMWEARLGTGEVWVPLRSLGFTLAGASSCLNPLFYAFRGQAFRQQLCQALGSCHGWGGGEGGRWEQGWE
ncbi:probable G-protein coupled receptor 32 [Trichechus manatus latirostris]|uniref:Probable G-protein coupled receptor 32 n=1 Tax=Trichechus manatus latirostris TaxID=127582 RepID=A0A2Y9DWS9_TRIMA|nr:probable G-protein coupled receptor 32 [Trichechus manatus latirostris]